MRCGINTNQGGIVVLSRSDKFLVPIDNIAWIQKDEYLTVIHTFDNHTYALSDCPIKSVLKAFPKKLTRIHSGQLVSIGSAIGFYRINSNLKKLIIKTRYKKHEVPMSWSGWSDNKRWFKENGVGEIKQTAIW